MTLGKHFLSICKTCILIYPSTNVPLFYFYHQKILPNRLYFLHVAFFTSNVLIGKDDNQKLFVSQAHFDFQDLAYG